MNLPKGKIEPAVSDDDGRMALANVFLDQTDKDQAKLVATDGKILAVIPVDIGIESIDKGKYVSSEALKMARKSKSSVISINVNENDTEVYASLKYAKFPVDPSYQYPNWRQVMAGIKEPKARVRLDVKLLKRLADALGSESVTIEIEDERKAVKVIGQNGTMGAIMPICREN